MTSQFSKKEKEIDKHKIILKEKWVLEIKPEEINYWKSSFEMEN